MKMQRIINVLPHGSGVNYDYEIKVSKDGKKVTVYNKYDFMDENGFYDDVFPFSVTFTAENITLHFHNLTSSQYRKINYNGLRDYLETIYFEVWKKVLAVLAPPVKVYTNKRNLEDLPPVQSGFIKTMVQDAIYNFRDGVHPEYIHDKLDGYCFTPQNIDANSLDNCLDVIRDAMCQLTPLHRAGLQNMTDYMQEDTGGEIYMGIVYGETNNFYAKEIAKTDKYWKFAHQSREISQSIYGDYRIFIE